LGRGRGGVWCAGYERHPRNTDPPMECQIHSAQSGPGFRFPLFIRHERARSPL